MTVLKFDDIPEVQVFEIAGAKHEPNRKLTCPTKSSVLHVLDQPLPEPGEMDIEINEKSEPCATSDASFPSFSKKIEKELSMHRRRGHIPYDRRCTHCLRSRSTIHHARTKESDPPIDHKLFLVQADYFFIDKYKFMLLAEGSSGLIGVASCGLNTDAALADCRKYFAQLGVTETNSMSVEILTDSEVALGNVLKKLH